MRLSGWPPSLSNRQNANTYHNLNLAMAVDFPANVDGASAIPRYGQQPALPRLQVPYGAGKGGMSDDSLDTRALLPAE